MELAAGLLEGTDVSHVTSPCCLEPATTTASMAIGEPKAIDDAPACGPERQWRMAKGRLSCLARNAGAAGRGRKSHRRHCGLGDRGAAALRPDQAKERSCGPRAEQHPRKKTWLTLKVPRKGPGDPGEEREAVALKKDGAPFRPFGPTMTSPQNIASAMPETGAKVEALMRPACAA